MLLDALKEENNMTQGSDDLAQTLNDISNQHGFQASDPPAVSNNTTKPSIAKTEKDKFNAKERRNSRYYVRSGDKEAIQCRANSLKRAINTVLEHSGLYDHKPKHGYVRDRKHSLASINIPSSPKSSSIAPPPINIISPSTSESQLADSTTDVLSALSPLPDQRRSSMDEYFFGSVSLPVPKQFADAASRRSSGIPESIKEEEGNGVYTDDVKSVETNTMKYESSSETEYKYDVGYLGLSNENDGQSCVPYEVYERNLLRSSLHNVVEIIQSDESKDTEKMDSNQKEGYTLQVPLLLMSELESMERPPNVDHTAENVYEGEKMTIIDTDPPVSGHSNFYFPFASPLFSIYFNCLRFKKKKKHTITGALIIRRKPSW